MSKTIQIKLTDNVCPLGEAYAQKHATTPPKTAVISCDGACLRGEIARRSANIVTHKRAPGRTVRICHGGFLETGGGMRKLVEGAEQVIVLDGCPMRCGSRLTEAAFPDTKLDVIITDALVEFDRGLFGIDEMTEEEIQSHAHKAAEEVAEKIRLRVSEERVKLVSA